MAEQPPQEFGKRRPVTPLPPAQQPVKRSGHVALLLMGTFAIGSGAYALMPGNGCAPKSPGMTSPALPQAGADCSPRGSSSGGGHGGSGGYWSRSNFFGGDALANRSSPGTASDSGSGNVTRGGFGSFARAFSVHFSGGG